MSIEVTVLRRYKGLKYEQNQPAYGFAVNSGSAVPVPPQNSPPGTDVAIPYPDPAIFYFENTANPSIVNFDTLYVPTYDRHPRFTLVILEDVIESDSSDNEIIKYIEPKLTVVDDIITQVDYDLSGLGLMSGYIVINK